MTFIIELKEFNNIYNNILIHDSIHQKYIIISIMYKNNNFIITNMFIYKYNVPKQYNKLITNGKGFLYKYPDYIIFNNTFHLFVLSILNYEIELIILNFKEKFNNSVGDIIYIGNMTTRKKISIANYDKTKYILDGIIIDNEILFETFHTLDIPILENNITYDSLDIFFILLNDITFINSIFDCLKNDKLCKVKIDILIERYIDIINYLKSISTENYIIFFDISLLYIIISYISYFKEDEINHKLLLIARDNTKSYFKDYYKKIIFGDQELNIPYQEV